jgi:hypothetical protein|tara:strand:- start:1339 stop:1548 length:210 start_codon:yes stop_codon:yes gene_type:complete
MITSRQIVDIIRKEKDKTTATEEMRVAYDNILNRIEVKEDVELQNRYSSFGLNRDNARMSKDEIEKVFK